MAKSTKKSKYTSGSLLLLLAFAFYVGFFWKKDNPATAKPAVEIPAKKSKKAKEDKPLRYLTVLPKHNSDAYWRAFLPKGCDFSGQSISASLTLSGILS